MYSIYFDTRKLLVCRSSSAIKANPNSIIYSYGDNSQLKELPYIFRKNTGLRQLYIPALEGEEENVFKIICSEFNQINAGGGLVSNDKGEYLLIFRNGFWDLSKGKQEPNEDIRNTALREVEEECGISNLQLKELICITRHTYMLNGSHILKHTYWYKMDLTKEQRLCPQLEENIQKCIWVNKNDLHLYLNKTYPSIVEVFENI